MSEFALQGAGVLKHEVGDVAEPPNLLRTEHSAVSFARIANRRRDMPSPVPRDVVEVNRLQVVPVAVATELERLERRGMPNRVRNDMVKGSIQRPRRSTDRERRGAAQEATSALRVDIGAVLKGSIQAGDESDLALDPLERLQGGRQLDRARANRGLSLHDRTRIAIEGRQARMQFPGEETSTYDADWHVVERETAGRPRLGGS